MEQDDRQRGSAEGGPGVSATEYDGEWIERTWGWDTPEEFVRSQGRNLRPRVRRAIELAGISPGMRILDVGCGRGEVVLECARRGALALGIDYSAPAIHLAEEARKGCSPEERSRSRFVVGDVMDLGPDNGSFDRIFLLDLVEHLYDWELLVLLRQLEGRLATNGLVIIHTLPNRWLYDVTYSRLLRLFAPWLKKNPRGKKEMAIHVNEMSITHLDQLMTRTGFHCRVWLEEQITSQSQWHKRHPLSDRRGRLYRWMANPLIGSIYRGISLTPLRFLIVNDIFCFAWRRQDDPPIPWWHGWMERVACATGRRWVPWQFDEQQ